MYIYSQLKDIQQEHIPQNMVIMILMKFQIPTRKKFNSINQKNPLISM